VTRLSEALERARANGDDAGSLLPPAAGASSPAGSGDDMAHPWRFDDQEETAAQAQEALALAEPPDVPPDAFDFRFGECAAGKVVVGHGADGGLVEQYRRLGAVLHHAQTQRGARSVMVASAVAAEGKTLTSTNLALTMSHSYQRRVLLIDADLRRPGVHEMFRLQNRAGLGDGLKHPEIGRLPVQRISPTLWVLTAGHPNPDPMSGLVSDTMKQVIAEATQQFDWVVIDTPPVALMPDANLLAGMIDSALLVVNAGRTPYPLVKRAIDAIGAARILGVVLNRAEQRDLAGGEGYYGYYYSHYEAPREERGALGFRLFGKKSA
jgi:protein-tyrosine kinase